MSEALSVKESPHQWKFILVGLALIAFPFLSFIADNFNDLAFVASRFLSDAAGLYMVCVIFFVGLPAILEIVLKRPFGRIILPFSLLWVALCQYTYAFKIVERIPFHIDEAYIGFPIMMLYILAFTTLILIMRLEAVRSLFTVFAVIVVSIAGVRVSALIISGFSSNQIDQSNHTPTMSPRNVADINFSPNIYYIIVDAYTSPKAMKHYVDLDLTDFLEEMRGLGMSSLSDARSPYNTTFLSLAAIFNMDYPLVNGEKSQATGRNSMFPSLLRNKSAVPRLVQAFKDLGYNFNHIGNIWAPCNDMHVTCLDFDKPKSIIGYEFAIFLQSTPYKLYHNVKFPQYDDAIGNLNRYLNAKGIPENPAFNFIHQLSPHPPYTFEADCKIRENYDFGLGAWEEADKPLYADNVKCLNKKLLTFVRLIKAKDPEAIVIVTGDHGTNFQKNGIVLPGRMQVLSLVSFPKKQCDISQLAQDTNSINLVRMAYACAGGKPVNLLKNRMFFGNYQDFENSSNGFVRRVEHDETIIKKP